MRRIVVLLLAALMSCGISAQIKRFGNIGIGVNHKGADSLLTSHFNLGIFGNVDTLHGAQLSLLTSVARQETKGVNIGILSAFTRGKMFGVQLAGFIDGVDGEMRGVQLAGVSNVAKSANGIQLAGLTNTTATPMRGVQMAGVTNVAMGVKRGMQVAGAANICSSNMQGLQFAMYNYADTLNGSQFGIINICNSHPKGVQVGLINYSRDTIAHKIGLVNINPKTRTDMMFYGGTSTKLNFAMRFRNRSTYNILGVGTHFMGIDEKFSGALFYRIGQYFQLNPRLSLSGDVGYYHVETFVENSDTKPERLFSLQARLNADYQLTRTLSAFASVGIGDTRYYHHATHYRTRPIFEMGVAVKYLRSEERGEKSEERGEKSENSVNAANCYSYGNLVPHSSLLAPHSKKYPWLAALETFGINAFVWSFDSYIMDEEFAKISIHTVKHNIKNGFVWDNDQFSTNLFAHPYHGGLYFNAARSNGLNFWESAPYSFGGSLMWEMVCEIEPPAINDLMATTMGGICIGEVTYRLSDLVLDDSKRGFPRFMREFLGTLICPIKGLNRIIRGDAWKVRHENGKYHDYNHIPVNFGLTVGDRYLADNNSLFRGEHAPFVNLALQYGDPFKEDTRKPYDYFTADLTFNFSGNQPLISGVHLLGRLWGTPIKSGDNMKTEIGIFQHFNYFDSQPVKDGTNLVPFRISEAASIGPGVIYHFPRVGNLSRLEQRIFLSGILLGGSLSDYYNVIDRDYNLGSGFSAKTNTILTFGHFGTFVLDAHYYRIYTWKGYEDKDLSTIDPLYLNAQGDKGNATLLVMSPRLVVNLGEKTALNFSGTYYYRHTYYKYHDNVDAKTFEVGMGLTWKL